MLSRSFTSAARGALRRSQVGIRPHGPSVRVTERSGSASPDLCLGYSGADCCFCRTEGLGCEYTTFTRRGISALTRL
jgi:hypothetical protein